MCVCARIFDFNFIKYLNAYVPGETIVNIELFKNYFKYDIVFFPLCLLPSLFCGRDEIALADFCINNAVVYYFGICH